MNILIILGHPSLQRKSLCEVLAEAYKTGAEAGGHEVHLYKIAEKRFDPILHEGYKKEQPPEPDIADAQEKIRQADHIVIAYPMWQFMMPALLKGFFERVFTKGFAYQLGASGGKMLKGKSARIIQTMGMPEFAYRFVFREHGRKVLSNMLGFCGITPVRVTYLGMAEAGNDVGRVRALEKVQALGRKGK